MCLLKLKNIYNIYLVTESERVALSCNNNNNNNTIPEHPLTTTL